MDQAPMGPDIELIDGDVVFVDTGTVRNAGQQRLVIPATIVAAPSFGVPIAVFAVHSLKVTGTVTIDTLTQSTAAVFLSADDIVVDGVLFALTGSQSDFAVLCMGSFGASDANSYSGAGGSGNATDGAHGGGPAVAPGGFASPDPALIPLRGGCEGRMGINSSPMHGGGAIQLTSSTSITIGSNAKILANGRSSSSSGDSGTGGSSGGGILLEAPHVTIAAGAVLSANGSGGQAGDGTGPTERMDGSQSKGGLCSTVALCIDGGDGNTAVAGPTPGPDSNLFTDTDPTKVHYGGGGGAGGHIRVNTLDGKALSHPGVTISPTETAGAIGLR